MCRLFEVQEIVLIPGNTPLSTIKSLNFVAFAWQFSKLENIYQ